MEKRRPSHRAIPTLHFITNGQTESIWFLPDGWKSSVPEAPTIWETLAGEIDIEEER